jgi:hypothetical protein
MSGNKTSVAFIYLPAAAAAADPPEAAAAAADPPFFFFFFASASSVIVAAEIRSTAIVAIAIRAKIAAPCNYLITCSSTLCSLATPSALINEIAYLLPLIVIVWIYI